MGSFAGCKKEETTEETSSTTSVASEQTSVTSDETTTAVSETSIEVTVPSVPEDTSWHYGTVKRPENHTLDEHRLLFQVPVHIDCSDVYDLVYPATFTIEDIEGSDQEAKMSEIISSKFEQFRTEEWNHIGSAVMEKMYNFHWIEVYPGSFTIINNVLSFPVERYDRFGSAKGEVTYYQTRAVNLNVVTGEIMQLRDLFYEDTDYVSLLNEMINDWLFANYDQGEIIPFEGIKEDQEFYFSDDGSLSICLYDDVCYKILSSDVVRITAISDAVKTDDSTSNRVYIMPGTGYSEEVVQYAETYTDEYYGVKGVSEKRWICCFCEVPDSVYEYLSMPDFLKDDPKEIATVKSIFSDCHIYFETSIQIREFGGFYCANVWRSSRIDPENIDRYTDENLEALYSLTPSGNESVLFDQEGNLIQMQDLFREDVDLTVILADRMISEWKSSGGDVIGFFEEKMESILKNDEYEKLYAEIQQADFNLLIDGIFVNFDDGSYYYLEWNDLLEYMK